MNNHPLLKNRSSNFSL